MITCKITNDWTNEEQNKMHKKRMRTNKNWQGWGRLTVKKKVAKKKGKEIDNIKISLTTKYTSHYVEGSPLRADRFCRLDCSMPLIAGQSEAADFHCYYRHLRRVIAGCVVYSPGSSCKSVSGPLYYVANKLNCFPLMPITRNFRTIQSLCSRKNMLKEHP